MYQVASTGQSGVLESFAKSSTRSLALEKCDDPRSLLLGFWHNISPRSAQQIKRLLWGQTGEHEHARCHENRSTKPVATMKREVFSFGERRFELLQEQERWLRERGHTAIGDRKGEICDSLLMTERSFFCKV